MKPSLLFFLVGSLTQGAELLPHGRLFPITFTDPREIKMSIGLQQNQQIAANVGNYVSLVQFDLASEVTGVVGIEGAGFFQMRAESGRFPLETTDGLLGIYQEVQWKNFRGQLRFSHMSSHLSDGSNRHPIAYSREWITARVLYDLNQTFLFYAGLQYLTHSIPIAEPWAFQSGFEFFYHADSSFLPFVGFDFKWREESDIHPNLAFQIGLALKNSREYYRNFKLVYSFYTGENYRGQYYNEFLAEHSLGIEMQL